MYRRLTLIFISIVSLGTSLQAQADGFGDPLAGLTQEQLDLFSDGKRDFEEVETVADGLGPVFNAVSCVACHSAPAVGGSSGVNETRFGRLDSSGHFDPMTASGGSLIQVKGITDGACVQPGEIVPAEATIHARRNTQPLFGMGLLEAVPESQILAHADPKDLNHDGISGRLNIVIDPVTGRRRVGRFGWKAQVPSLLIFSGDAYLNEMGITNTLFPTENAPNGNSATCLDGIEPSIDDQDLNGNGISDGVDAFADFMRFLGPPPRNPPGNGPVTDDVAEGAEIFENTGCATCHIPSMRTGQVPDVPALSRKKLFPFSDLLLHDMGSLGDGIVQGGAAQREMRTQPLWGLRKSAPYLHDGRAATITDAILKHDGEARASRNAFRKLLRLQRQQLLAFLNHI